MNRPHLLIRIAAIIGALFLGTGFIMYQTHDLDRLLASAKLLPADKTVAYQAAMFMPQGSDTTEIQRRLVLLDSTQRSFLGLLAGQFPPPDGTSYFDRDYLDTLLSGAGERSRQVMFSSSKSAKVLRVGQLSFRMIDSIRMILLTDTAKHDRRMQEHIQSDRFSGVDSTVRMDELIYPRESGIRERMERMVGPIDSFPMSPLGTYGSTGGDTTRQNRKH